MHVLICEWQCRPFEGLLIIIVVVIRELCQVSGVRCQVSVSVSVCVNVNFVMSMFSQASTCGHLSSL
jgi:hypothetical protein